MSMATMVNEKPILFRGEMVRAILDGRKTQTRRIVKPQPKPGESVWPCGWTGTGWAFGEDPACVEPSGCFCRSLRCPYGPPGDRLWVRETWRCNHVAGMRIEYKAGGACLEFEDWPKDAIPPYACPTSPSQVRRTERQLNGEKIPDAWRPSIHMPRWACRLVLEITDVRVERLNDISATDAEAEGVKWNRGPLRCGHTNPISAFRGLWESINGAGSWAANPWVWVVSFRRIEL